MTAERGEAPEPGAEPGPAPPPTEPSAPDTPPRTEADAKAGPFKSISFSVRPPDFSTPGRDSFRLLFAALLVIGVGNSMLLAVLPSLARELTLSEAQVGWIFSFSAVLWVLCSPIWGRRSDVWGRKRTIVIGLAGYSISMLGCAAFAELGVLGWISSTAAFVGLILARAVFGALGSASNPAAQAYIADHSTPENRTEEIAALTSAFALGSAMGPGLCALLAGWVGPVAPLAMTAALAAIGAWGVMRYLPEPEGPPPSQRSDSAQPPGAQLALDERVSGHLLYGLALSAATAILAQTFGFFLIDRLGLTPRQAVEPTAACFMVGALAVLTAQTVLLPRLKLAPRGLMALGSALLAAGVLIQIAAPSLGGLLFAQLIQGFGFGLARPGFTGGASLAVRPEEQGAIAGLIVGVSGAGFVISPIAGGYLYEAAGATAPLWLCFAISIAMGVFARRSRRLKAGEAPYAPSDPTAL